jgi:quercetin dioxygenase-like cupin family protein
MNRHSILSEGSGPIPPDDLARDLVVADPEDSTAPHIGLAGDTYTVLLAGEDTDGRYCLIDMLVPPGGGPPPHRHDFEESFTVLHGQIEVAFRGKTHQLRAGQTANIPANAPHSFKNAGPNPARMLCICAPAGNEALFEEVGVRVAGRTTPPPKMDEASEKAARAKAKGLAAKYRTEFV